MQCVFAFTFSKERVFFAKPEKQEAVYAQVSE